MGGPRWVCHRGDAHLFGHVLRARAGAVGGGGQQGRAAGAGAARRQGRPVRRARHVRPPQHSLVRGRQLHLRAAGDAP
eukprot:3309071-Prymnesium_polylepis.1